MLLPILLNNQGGSGPLPPPIPVPASPTGFTATLTPGSFITAALRRINAYAPGQQIAGVDSADLLETLNDMLAGWSINKLTIFCSTENILSWISGQNQYTIGNPVGGTFTGTLLQGNNLISNVALPSNLIIGGSVVDANGYIPPNTTITGIGSDYVALSQNSLYTTVLPEQFQFTTPGDFPIDRPVRITNAFTRIVQLGVGGLDFPIQIIALKEWNTYLLKNLPGPWPLKMYYDPTFPLGTIYCYPAPSAGTELHLWTDTILNQFTNIDQPVNLPPGYARAIKWNLAREIWTEYYDDPIPAGIMKMAEESRKDIERLNVIPQPISRYDRAIVRNRGVDAGWILSGGFTQGG
jgi:hypothetical protein